MTINKMDLPLTLTANPTTQQTTGHPTGNRTASSNSRKNIANTAEPKSRRDKIQLKGEIRIKTHLKTGNDEPVVPANLRLYNKTLEQKSKIFQQYKRNINLNEKSSYEANQEENLNAR